MNASVGRHMALTLWMLALLVIVVFVTLARGPIHEAAWTDDCKTFRSGGAVPTTPTAQPIHEVCRDLDLD